jgi:hypothetical protein
MAIMIRKFKKGEFLKFENFLLWHVGNIINFNNSTQKSIQIHFLMAFSIHEVAPFCFFCHFLLFLCSDIIQIFNCILIGGNLWIKGVPSKPSGDCIVAPIFCFLS